MTGPGWAGIPVPDDIPCPECGLPGEVYLEPVKVSRDLAKWLMWCPLEGTLYEYETIEKEEPNG